MVDLQHGGVRGDENPEGVDQPDRPDGPVLIAPTVGRVLHFYTTIEGHEQGPFAALIACVNDDGTINITFFDTDGTVSNATDIPIVGEDDRSNFEDYCVWMPYQIGQAKRPPSDAEIDEAVRRRIEALGVSGEQMELSIREAVARRLDDSTERENRPRRHGDGNVQPRDGGRPTFQQPPSA